MYALFLSVCGSVRVLSVYLYDVYIYVCEKERFTSLLESYKSELLQEKHKYNISIIQKNRHTKRTKGQINKRTNRDESSRLSMVFPLSSR